MQPLRDDRSLGQILRDLREETTLLAGGVQMPHLTTRFRDRHALVVARSAETKRDLSIVAPSKARPSSPIAVNVIVHSVATPLT